MEDLAERKEIKKVDWRRIKRRKDSAVFQTVEEVFDEKTVMALYQMINQGIIEGMSGVVKAGKESRIYLAKGTGGEDLAVKIFLTSSMEFKKSMLQYIKGDPRFKVGHDYRRLVYTWAQKEFRNLTEAHNAKIKVPKPLHATENIIVMEFIGENGVSAPILKELSPEELTLELYNGIIDSVDKLYNVCGLVHADLSEYNVMVWKGEPYLIDFGQAVLRVHPMAEEFLKRDIDNIIRFFDKAGIDVPESEAVIKWLNKT